MSKENNNSTLKIFALIIAVVLWSYVMSEVNPEETKTYRNLSVNFTNTEALDRKGIILMGPNEANVTVRVAGKKFDLADFDPEFIRAQVDLSGYNEGQVRVPINVLIEQFSNVWIDNIEPSEIIFTFDRIIPKEMPVTINTTGNLGNNYVLGDVSTRSQYVMLRGPRSIVNEVAQVIAVVDISDRTEEANLTRAIKLVDDQGNDVPGVTVEPSVIDINVPVFRTVNVPIELQTEVPENYEITSVNISPNRITLKGDNDIANLGSIQTKPVDIELLMNGDNLDVELDLPPNVSLLNPNERVTVSLEIQEAYTKTFEYSFDELEILISDEELTVEAGEEVPEIIEIEVKGTNEAIEALTKEDMEVYIDLRNREEGAHLIYIDVNLPEDLVINHISPQVIEVRLLSQ